MYWGKSLSIDEPLLGGMNCNFESHFETFENESTFKSGTCDKPSSIAVIATILSH